MLCKVRSVFTNSGHGASSETNQWFPTSGTNSDAQPLHDPRLCQVNTNPTGSPGAAGSTFLFDQYNNATDQYDLDYGFAPAITASCPGSPASGVLHHTQTQYVTTTNYTAAGTNLVSLPSEIRIYDGSWVLYSDTKYGYDETTPSGDPGLGTGHDNTNYGGAAARGNVTSIARYLSPTGNIWFTSTLTYDVAGNLLSVKDANAHTTTFGYSDNFTTDKTVRATAALRLSRTRPGKRARVQYDFWNGKSTKTTDANNVSTTYVYNDPLDRVTNVANAAGTSVEARTGYSYTSPTSLVTGQDLNSTGDQALTSAQYWDGFGRLTNSIQIENPADWSQTLETDTAYDALGRVASTTVPYRNGSGGPQWPASVTTYTYDALNRPTAVHTPDGASATTSYSGNQTTVTDQAGKVKKYTTDASGRLTKVVEDPSGLNYSTSYTYRPDNGLQLVTQGSQTRTFNRDTFGRVYQTIEPESGSTYYSYDAVGNVVSTTDARGQVTGYNYDAIDRLLKITYHDGTPAVNYSYDTVSTYGKGRLASVSNTNSTTNIASYDPAGRVLTSNQTTGSYPQRAFTYTYNRAGGLTSETLPSGRKVSTVYDSAARPSTLSGLLGTTTTNYVTQSSYWPNGVPWYFVRSPSNNVWSVTSVNSRLQVAESYEAINNTNSSTQMLFVSCPDWGVNPSDYGAYAICPLSNRTNDNGILQGYTEFQGGPGYGTMQSFTQTLAYDGVNRLSFGER